MLFSREHCNAPLTHSATKPVSTCNLGPSFTLPGGAKWPGSSGIQPDWNSFSPSCSHRNVILISTDKCIFKQNSEVEGQRNASGRTTENKGQDLHSNCTQTLKFVAYTLDARWKRQIVPFYFSGVDYNGS